MIKIVILVNDGKIYDEFENKNTNLSENALCMRKIEEVKDALLEMEYENELEIDNNNEEPEDDE